MNNRKARSPTVIRIVGLVLFFVAIFGLMFSLFRSFGGSSGGAGSPGGNTGGAVIVPPDDSGNEPGDTVKPGESVKFDFNSLGATLEKEWDLDLIEVVEGNPGPTASTYNNESENFTYVQKKSNWLKREPVDLGYGVYGYAGTQASYNETEEVGYVLAGRDMNLNIYGLDYIIIDFVVCNPTPDAYPFELEFIPDFRGSSYVNKSIRVFDYYENSFYRDSGDLTSYLGSPEKTSFRVTYIVSVEENVGYCYIDGEYLLTTRKAFGDDTMYCDGFKISFVSHDSSKTFSTDSYVYLYHGAVYSVLKGVSGTLDEFLSNPQRDFADLFSE